jgi:hypothetical protein
MEYDKKGQLES